MVWKLFERMRFSVVQFDESGQPLAASLAFFRLLMISAEESTKLPDLFPATFRSDLLAEVSRSDGAFCNYRIRLQRRNGEGAVLFNVSGYRANDGRIKTLWQEVARAGDAAYLQQGSLSANVCFLRLIEPYIPQLVRLKAREIAHNGYGRLPAEVIEQTIVFADLVGFTELSETLDPTLVVELLNLAHSVMVNCVRGNSGKVDKFMGDAIMALFDDPLGAVNACAEIQATFAELNVYRSEAGAPPVNLRIGINTGTVIMADVGTEERKDWTAIGDAVNTAARIEKHCPPGAVLLSAQTFDRVRHRVVCGGERNIQVKGKVEAIKVYSLQTVALERAGQAYEIALG